MQGLCWRDLRSKDNTRRRSRRERDPEASIERRAASERVRKVDVKGDNIDTFNKLSILLLNRGAMTESAGATSPTYISYAETRVTKLLDVLK